MVLTLNVRWALAVRRLASGRYWRYAVPLPEPERRGFVRCHKERGSTHQSRAMGLSNPA